MANYSRQLKNLDIGKLKMKNGKTLENNLKTEAKRLKRCIQNRLDEYLRDNPPSIYRRTGGFENSLTVDDFLSVSSSGMGLQISLFFDKGANHMSGDGIEVWNGTGEEVNTAYLLNYGYEVKKDVWFKSIENFGYREGGYFVEKGIEDFNKQNTLGIKIEICKPNGYLV